VTSPEPKELAALARRAGIPFLFDIGSGLLADLSRFGLTDEPRVQEAVLAGADLVLFSGDKLLGGPQAGCLVGTAVAIARCRSNPFARALRADKFSLAALEATLALYRDPDTALRDIPVLAMLTRSAEVLQAQAVELSRLVPSEYRPELKAGESAVGGGSFPGAALPTTLVALDPGPLGANGLALRLRVCEPAVVARVEAERVLLDPRTVQAAEFESVGRALADSRG
jgi:L-seryl-tRNA(Ser) seleniumtransferase